jgi:hypothetical protein
MSETISVKSTRKPRNQDGRIRARLSLSGDLKAIVFARAKAMQIDDVDDALKSLIRDGAAMEQVVCAIKAQVAENRAFKEAILASGEIVKQLQQTSLIQQEAIASLKESIERQTKTFTMLAKAIAEKVR